MDSCQFTGLSLIPDNFNWTRRKAPLHRLYSSSLFTKTYLVRQYTLFFAWKLWHSWGTKIRPVRHISLLLSSPIYRCPYNVTVQLVCVKNGRISFIMAHVVKNSSKDQRSRIYNCDQVIRYRIKLYSRLSVCSKQQATHQRPRDMDMGVEELCTTRELMNSRGERH